MSEVEVKLECDSKLKQLTKTTDKFVFDEKYNYCVVVRDIGNVKSDQYTLICCGKINKKDKIINYIDNNDIPEEIWQEMGFEKTPENMIN